MSTVMSSINPEPTPENPTPEEPALDDQLMLSLISGVEETHKKHPNVGSIKVAAALAEKYRKYLEEYKNHSQDGKLAFANTVADQSTTDLQKLRENYAKRAASSFTKQGDVMMSNIVDFWKTGAGL